MPPPCGLGQATSLCRNCLRFFRSGQEECARETKNVDGELMSTYICRLKGGNAPWLRRQPLRSRLRRRPRRQRRKRRRSSRPFASSAWLQLGRSTPLSGIETHCSRPWLQTGRRHEKESSHATAGAFFLRPVLCHWSLVIRSEFSFRQAPRMTNGKEQMKTSPSRLASARRSS